MARNCKYQLEDGGRTLKFNSDKELTNYIRTMGVDKNSIKYSKVMSERQSVIFNKLYKNKPNGSGINIHKYLSLEHDLGKGPEYLAPQFNVDNYIKSEAEERIKQADNLTEEDLEKVQEEIKAELEEDNVMKNNGMSIHSIVLSAMESHVSSDKTKKLIDEFIDSVAEYDKKKNLGKFDEELKEDYRKNITLAVRNFINFTSTQGAAMTKPTLKQGAISDKPDVVAVDNEGNANIIDITLSRKPYSEWNSAKKLNQAYKLGIFRQMAESLFPTNDSGLFVGQFIMKDMDLSNFIYGSQVDVLNDVRGLHYYDGRVTKKLKKLIPSEFTDLHFTSTEVDEKSEQMVSAMFPNYKVRSKFEIADNQALIESIKKNKEKNNSDYWVLYDKLTNETVKIEKESEIEGIVTDYTKRYEESKNSEVSALIKSVKTAISNKQKYIEFEQGGAKDRINILFNKYLDGNWEVVNNPIFSNQGMVALRNSKYNSIEVVSVTTNNLKSVYNLGLGNTMVGKFRNNDVAKTDSKIKPAAAVNIEAVRMLTVLNNTPELFDNNTLSGIKVINYKNDQAGYSDLGGNIHNFNELFELVSARDKVENVNNNFKSGKIKESNPFDYWYDEILEGMSKLDKASLSEHGKGIRPDAAYEKLEWFKKIQRSLVEAKGSLINNPEKHTIDNGVEEYLFNLVGAGIAYYSNIQFNFDYDVPSIGVKGSDIMHLPQTIIYGEGSEYSKSGQRVVGLFGGSNFRTTDSTLSKDFDQMHDLVANAHSKVRESYAKYQNRIIAKTNEYYKKAGRSGLEKVLLGKSEPYHEVLFKTSNGKIDERMLYKNPYDMSENLKDHERDYLKFMLWEMYKFKAKLDKEFHKIDYKDLEKHEMFNEFINDEKYFIAPLGKKTDLSKFSSTDTFRQSIGKRFEEFKDDIDPRMITEMQRGVAENDVNGAYKMYNEFSMDSNFRDRMIGEYGAHYFEKNMDTMGLKLIFSSIRENVMNDVLPIISAATTQMKYHGHISGDSKAMEKAMEDFYKQLRISVYGIEPIKGEIQEPLKIVKQFQKMASMMYITLRPALMFKELITGTFRNVSYAWTKVYGDNSFTQSDLSKAYNKVLFSKAQTPFDFNVIDNLNIHYGIANMDLNTIVNKTKTDRHGLFKFFSDNLYWFNNAPDYVNRMTLFVAKMIHDGCYDAHTIDKDGNFKYDATKDGRFKNYFAKRKKYKYQYANNDKEYNDERSLYMTMLEDFNSENTKLNQPLLLETDDLPRAYTHKERESIKVFSDMAYGFYDHERSALWKHTAFGSLFGQFLTYWPAKVKYYFGKESDSKYGQYEQKYTLDPESGEKKMIYLKDTFDEEGNINGQEETLEDTGRKSMHFKGSTSEGLMYSLGLTLRDLTLGKSNETPDARKRRAKLAIHDLLVGMMLAALLRVLYEEWGDGKGEITDNDYANQMLGVTEKAFYKALKESDPIDSVFGAFSWEPTFVSMLSNVQRDFTGLFEGNSKSEAFFRNNFKMLEVFPTVFDD